MSVTLIDLILVAFLVLFTIAWVRILMLRHQMERTEKRLRQNGIHPQGRLLCHGMVRSENGVLHDSKPSRSWYARLAR